VNIVADPCPCRRLGEYALPNARGSTSATVASCTRYTALLHSISGDAGKRRRETSLGRPCFLSLTSIRFSKYCRRSSIVSPSGLLQPLRQIILQAGLLGIPLPASTPNGVPDSTFMVAVSIGFVLDSFNSTHQL
jgi:hypothetical protein